MGENGAGKSTLMKILSGVLARRRRRRSGSATGTVRFASVRDAERAGIAIIHQELNLVPELSVAANIFLGREPLIGGLFLDRRAMAAAARRLLARLGIDLDPERAGRPACASASSSWSRSPRRCRSTPAS